MIFPFVLCSSQLEEELKEDVLVFIENLITVNKDLTTCVSMRNIHVHIFSIRMKILIWQKSIFFLWFSFFPWKEKYLAHVKLFVYVHYTRYPVCLFWEYFWCVETFALIFTGSKKRRQPRRDRGKSKSKSKKKKRRKSKYTRNANRV